MSADRVTCWQLVVDAVSSPATSVILSHAVAKNLGMERSFAALRMTKLKVLKLLLVLSNARGVLS